MTLISKRVSVLGWDLTLAIARTPLKNGGVRYSERIELQRSGTNE